MRNKPVNYVFLISVFILLMVAFAGCGSSEDASMANTADEPMADTTDMMGEAAIAPESYGKDSQTSGDYVEDSSAPLGDIAPDSDAQGDNSQSSSFGGEELQSATNDQRKIIINSWITMETDSFDQSVSSVKQLVSQEDGYLENSTMSVEDYYGQKDFRFFSAVIKIPWDKYEHTKTQLASYGKVINTNEQADDVTAQYDDYQTQLKTKKIEEQRILKLMEQATTIEEILTLEVMLGDVREQISILEANIKNIERNTAYSTINLTINEVENLSELTFFDSGLGDTMKDAFIGSINFIIKTLETVAITISFLILPLSILALFVFCLTVLIKKIRKKRIKTNPKA